MQAWKVKISLLDKWHQTFLPQIQKEEMSSIFQFELLEIDRHIARVERAINSAKKQQEIKKMKTKKTKEKASKPKQLKSTCNQNEAKSTTNQQQTADIQTDEESMTIPVAFLPPNTHTNILKIQNCKLIQANSYITSQIKALALQKYAIEQRIHQLQLQERAYASDQ